MVFQNWIRKNRTVARLILFFGIYTPLLLVSIKIGILSVEIFEIGKGPAILVGGLASLIFSYYIAINLIPHEIIKIKSNQYYGPQVIRVDSMEEIRYNPVPYEEFSEFLEKFAESEDLEIKTIVLGPKKSKKKKIRSFKVEWVK